MSWEVVLRLVFELLTNIFGHDWSPDDVAAELRKLKANPPRKAQVPDFDSVDD